MATKSDMERLSSIWLPAIENIPKLLSTMTGYKCSLKEIIKTNKAAMKFVDALRKSDEKIKGSLAHLYESTKRIISTTSTIFGLNRNLHIYYCVNGKRMDYEYSPKMSPGIYYKNIELIDHMYEAVQIIEKMPETEKCKAEAAKELQEVLSKFPADSAKCLNP